MVGEFLHDSSDICSLKNFAFITKLKIKNYYSFNQNLISFSRDFESKLTFYE